MKRKPFISTTKITKTRHTSIENVTATMIGSSGGSGGQQFTPQRQQPPSILIHPANSPEEYHYQHELNPLNLQQQQQQSSKVTIDVGRRRASVTSTQMTTDIATVSSIPDTSRKQQQQQQTTLSLNPSAARRRKSWDQKVTGPIRRASQALINLSGVLYTGSDNVSSLSTTIFGHNYYGQCSRRDSRSRTQEIILMCSSFQRLPMKDFGAEVRASMDVDQFLQQAVLLLDITETSLEGIVDRMLRKVIDGREPLTTLKEAKTALFTHDSGELQLLARTIQGTYISDGGGFDYDQSWLCSMCSLPSLARRHVAIARLKHPANMGRNSHEVRFFILVVTPSKEKGTKNALETGRTFATIFADIDFRQKLLDVHGEAEFKGILLKHAQDLASEQSNPTRRMGNHEPEAEFEEPRCHFAQGLYDDLRRRTSHYLSDYVDGLVGRKTIQKTISTIFFLYFACILPTIAFGVLNNNNTAGKIGDIRKAIIGQTIGGLSFAFLGGQPLVIIMTTAPICLYIKVIYNICEDFQLDFHAMYACVGLWNTFFLVLYAVFDLSKLMKWCTRSTEEIFSLFISIAFAVDAGRDVIKNFQTHYYSPLCLNQLNRTSDRQHLLQHFRQQAQVLAQSNLPLIVESILPSSFSNTTIATTTAATTAIINSDLLSTSTLNYENNSNLNLNNNNPNNNWTDPIYQTAFFLGHSNYSLFSTTNSNSNNNHHHHHQSYNQSVHTNYSSSDIIHLSAANVSTLATTLASLIWSPEANRILQNLTTAALKLIFTDLHMSEDGICRRETSLLFLLLMLGTVWMAVSLFNFNKTPYLQASKRELLADYALPCSVIILSFIGSFVFRDIPVEHFRYDEELHLKRARLEDLPWTAFGACMGLGFSLSLLFFMDQNISAAMVNNPCNKLKKGCAYHLDLFVVGILNGFLSLYAFPWMHGVLPHSPLHVRSLADVEERVDQGHVYEIIVKVRETRLTGIVSHILIGLSVFLIPYPMAYIPTAVLDGLFLYMAITSLNGNQMFERITLLFMEQAAYPPNHYIRRCPQRKIHLFTLCQMVQLGLMCFFGFSPWPYIKMVFPVIVILLLPFRHKIVPFVIDNKYLEALDGENQ
nr:LOW QUALITY PROTEIN: solute carrier family 4 member 11-like [Dermatophagoides farinae]